MLHVLSSNGFYVWNFFFVVVDADNLHLEEEEKDDSLTKIKKTI